MKAKVDCKIIGKEQSAIPRIHNFCLATNADWF